MVHEMAWGLVGCITAVIPLKEVKYLRRSHAWKEWFKSWIRVQSGVVFFHLYVISVRDGGRRSGVLVFSHLLRNQLERDTLNGHA